MVRKLNKNKVIYKCCICDKVVDKRTITRLVKQLYGYNDYNQFAYVRKYDFCEECWWALDDLLFKWKRKKLEGVCLKNNKVL